MEYYPQDHRIHKSKSSNLDQHREITADVSVDLDNSSIYALSDPPPSALPTPVVPHPSTFSTYAALPPPSRLTPSGGSEDSKAGAIPSSSMDGTHDLECVCSALQRSSAANTGTTGDSECSMWDCTPRDILPLDESESSPALDGDALHARWDHTPEYSHLGVPRDTHSLHVHGRPLESRRPPPERSHRSPHPAVPALPQAPASHHRIRLPLLSVFVSLLSIDDATLHLVACSPAHPALFPGPIRSSDEGTGNVQEVHGILALILEPSRQHSVLRDGPAVACDQSVLPSNPFKISASPLIVLLGLVRGVWAG